jgi:8-oxo-dGTP pyrophosphatase MutT (NUDIX family)
MKRVFRQADWLSDLRSRLRTRDPAEAGALRRPAAILVLLSLVDGKPAVLLTVRSSQLSRHAGQVACPGGAYDPSDRTLWDTALREAAEEVGIVPAAVETVGQLSPHYIRVSGFTLVPWVGFVATPPPLKLAPSEVERVFWVTLERLWAHREVRPWPAEGPVQAWYPEFPIEEARVWGATAIVLDELLTTLRQEG